MIMSRSCERGAAPSNRRWPQPLCLKTRRLRAVEFFSCTSHGGCGKCQPVTGGVLLEFLGVLRELGVLPEVGGALRLGAAPEFACVSPARRAKRQAQSVEGC